MLSTGISDKADLHPNFLISKMRKYCFLYYDYQNKKQNYNCTRISVAPVTLLPILLLWVISKSIHLFMAMLYLLRILVCFERPKKCEVHGFNSLESLVLWPRVSGKKFFWNWSGGTPFGRPLKFWAILHSKIMISGHFQTQF